MKNSIEKGNARAVKKRKRCDEVELRKDILEKIQSQHDDIMAVLKKSLEQKDRLIIRASVCVLR